MKLHRLLSLSLPVLLLAASASVASGQTADADEMRARLTKGVAEYMAFRFEAAKATLLSVDPGTLTDGEKARRDEYLRKVDTAIKRQRLAREAVSAGEKAMKAGDFAAAQKAFTQAADDDYLPDTERAMARKQAATAAEKATAAAAMPATTAEPKAVEDKPAAAEGAEAKTDAPEVVAAAEPKPAAEPQPTTRPATPAILTKLADQRTERAAELLTEGKKALDANRVAEAVDYFDRAANLQPDNEEAQRLLKYARQLLAVPSETGVLSEVERQRRLVWQMAKVEIAKKMRESRETLAAAARAADFDTARTLAQQAEVTLKTQQNYFPPSDYRNQMREIERYLEYVKLLKQQWEEAEKQRLAGEIKQKEDERREREALERERKIENYTKMARMLREQHDYQKSLDVVEQLIALDSRNSWALEQRDILQQFVFLQDRKLSSRTFNNEEQLQMNEVEWKMVPWFELLHFPRDWREIRKRAERYVAAAAGEPEANRAVRQKLEQIIPELSFAGIPFKDVIEFLRNVSGVSIYVNWRALSLQGIDQTTEVTVHLRKVSMSKALNVVLSDVGGTSPLQYVLDDGVITISTKDDLSRRVATRVYDIRHLLFRVPNFVGPRVDLGNAGQSSVNNQQNVAWSGTAFGNNAGQNNVGEDNMPTRSEMIQSLIDLVKETVDRTSWDAGEASIREHHGSLVVTQTAQNHQELAKLLNSLQEARGMQISIEARFISVSTGFLNTIGVDFDLYFNLGGNLGGGGTVVDPFTGASVPAYGPSGWTTVGHGPSGGSSFTPTGVTTGTGQRTRNYGSLIGSTVNTGVSAGILTSVSAPALSIAGVFLDDLQVDFLLEATQAHSATRTLNAPRVTVWNGQRSYVTVATQTAYISGYQAIPSTGEGGEPITVPMVSFVPTGVTLDVEGTVSHDRKYVIMTVRPQVSSLQGPIVSVTTPAGSIGLPVVAVQDLQTTVMVPDGGTLLLGGQTLAGEVEQEFGVPMLSKVPIVQRLFTNRGKVRDKQVLLILIRPKIIIHEDEEENQFPL